MAFKRRSIPHRRRHHHIGPPARPAPGMPDEQKPFLEPRRSAPTSSWWVNLTREQLATEVQRRIR